MVVVWFVVAGVGALFFSLLRSELAPLEDRGVIFGRLQAPPGSTVDYTSEQLRAVERYYETIPEAAAYNAVAGFPTVDNGNAILRLKPWEERTRKQQDIARELNAKFQQLPGVIGFAVNPPSLGQSPRTLPIEYVIMAQMATWDAGLDPGDRDLRTARGSSWLDLVARLAPGVSIEQAQAELDTRLDRLARQFPDSLMVVTRDGEEPSRTWVMAQSEARVGGPAERPRVERQAAMVGGVGALVTATFSTLLGPTVGAGLRTVTSTKPAVATSAAAIAAVTCVALT